MNAGTMKKTVIVTGASSGIGYETALLFCKKDWNVVAAIRNTEKKDNELFKKEGIDIVQMDVLDVESIKKAVQYVYKKYSRIDAVVNNAGYAVVGPFETSTKQQVQKQFGTNVFGVMDVVREILPIFRKQKFGVIVNISSMGGKTTFPLYSLYHSTKWAVEGFSESLQYELKPFNIKVKIIEPGMIKTDFYGRSAETTNKSSLKAYDEFSKCAQRNMGEFALKGSHPKVVSETVFKAVNDNSWRMRYYVGKNAGMILILRKLLPDWIFHRIIRTILLKK